MELGHLIAGDKIATCPYCQTVVDLPDNAVEEFIRESSEEIQEEGRTVRRTQRTVERRSQGGMSGQPIDAGALGGIELGALPEAIREIVENASSVSTQSHSNVVQQSFQVTVNGQPGAPADLQGILENAGIHTPLVAPKPVQNAPATPSRKSSVVPIILGVALLLILLIGVVVAAVIAIAGVGVLQFSSG